MRSSFGNYQGVSMFRLRIFSFVLFFLTQIVAEATASTIVESINADAPLVAGASWGVPEAGFSYVPTVSYTLDGIATKFGGGCYTPPCYSQTVTFAIYQGLPGNLSLLGSGNVIPVANEFVTASISPILLLVGGTYFVAFQNINGIYANATYSGPVRTNLYFDETGNGSFDKGPDGVVIPEFGFVAQFSGTVSAVPLGPLPAIWSLFAGRNRNSWLRGSSQTLIESSGQKSTGESASS
jgi:hypothetical protein